MRKLGKRLTTPPSRLVCVGGNDQVCEEIGKLLRAPNPVSSHNHTKTYNQKESGGHDYTKCRAKMLSDKDIKKFQNIYKKRFGKDISKKDAYAQGIKLLRLMSLIYRPMTHKEFKEVQKRQTELQKN